MSNQEICRKLVNREVIYCVSGLIYELSRKDDFIDDLMETQLLQGEDYSESIDWYIENDISVRGAMEWLIETEMHMPYTGNAKNQLKRYLNENDEEEKIRFANDFNIEPERVEVYEHYIVSEWFANKLRGKGEIVEEFLGLTIWGRTCTGQAILLDGVIKQIASDMEILEGQKNEWKL